MGDGSKAWILRLADEANAAVDRGHRVDVFVSGIATPIEDVGDITIRDDNLAVISGNGFETVVRAEKLLGFRAADAT